MRCITAIIKAGIQTTKKNNVTNGVTSYRLTDGLIAVQMTKNGSGTVTDKLAFTYDSNDIVIAMRYNGTQYFYQKDGQGDIIGIVDGSGNVVVNYTLTYEVCPCGALTYGMPEWV